MSKLDILVNNAGVASTSNVETETLEKWRWLQSINLDAVFVGTQAAIGAMKESGGGSIINVASIGGIIGDPNLAAYNASKGGVRLFPKSAALHLLEGRLRHPSELRTSWLHLDADGRSRCRRRW